MIRTVGVVGAGTMGAGIAQVVGCDLFALASPTIEVTGGGGRARRR